jgi:hypothetical protein
MSRNHIRKPVTLTPEQAEKIYHARSALCQLTDELLDVGDEIPLNLLVILGDMFHNVIEENGGFQFE